MPVYTHIMKKCTVVFKIRKNHLLLWLLVVFTILLVASIGAFVFLSLNAKYHFACVFDCKEREIPVAREQGASPTELASATAVYNVTSTRTEISGSAIHTSEEPTQEGTERCVVAQIDLNIPNIHSRTPSTASPNFADKKPSVAAKNRPSLQNSTSANLETLVTLHKTRKQHLNQNAYISIRGKISFKGRAPKRFPRNSRLIVEFLENRFADAPSIVHGKTVVDLSQYRRGKVLSYSITCKRPELPRTFYSVSAVLNVGWKPNNKYEWIRKGDFITDIYFKVRVNKFKRIYDRNIQLKKYNH